MATQSDDMKDKLKGYTQRRYEDGDVDWGSQHDNIFDGDETYMCPTYVHQTPPCQGSCPSGEDIRGWLQVIRGIEKSPEGMTMQEYAFRRSTDANPFPATMGRVCPAPCEDGCNRNVLEDHVGINAVEQYIGDCALEARLGFSAADKDTGKKVAIIGGGPAGLACAYQLRRVGHAVTIYDNHKHLGGMMRYGIPGYRMPREVLDGEINRIVDMGIDVKYETVIGKDIALDELEKNFDAVVFAVGAQSGRPLPVPGAEAENCITGIAFLEAFNDGRLHSVSGRVLVIGGGDTSIDVASVARRLGHIADSHDKDRPENVVLGHTAHDVVDVANKEGADVTLISRHPVEKMTAAQHEIDDAQREGVDVRGGVTPIEVMLDSNGRATGLKVASLDFTSGKPEIIEGTEQVIESDLIVAAIGQTGSLDDMKEFANERGLIDADKHFQIPNKPGFFAIGDVIRPHLLTTVIGQGSIAAESIHHYLKQEELHKRPKVDVHHFDLREKLHETDHDLEEYHATGDDTVRAIDRGVRGTTDIGKSLGGFAIHNYEDRSDALIIPSDKLFLGHFDLEERHKRVESVPDADEVLGHFEERMSGLSEEQAYEESGRCMSCGMCFECDNCVIYCPQDAVHRTPKDETTFGRYVYTDYDRCIGCHICADVCPTGYIQMGLGSH